MEEFRVLYVTCKGLHCAQVIQTETDLVFGHPQFVTLRPEAVVHILQQDGLSVEEIDVWRASLAWARHQLIGVGAEPSPRDLRRTLEPLLFHTRLRTVPLLDLSNEVAPTEVLTAEEYERLCVAISKKLQPKGLPCVSNEIQPRKKIDIVKVLDIGKHASGYDYYCSSSSCSIMTAPDIEVVLTKFELKTNESPLVPEGLTYECEVKVAITEATEFLSNTPTNPREITVNRQVPYDKLVTVNLPDIVLKPDAKYYLEMTIMPKHKAFDQNVYFATNDVSVLAHSLPGEVNVFGTHMYTLRYKTRATPKREDLQAD